MSDPHESYAPQSPDLSAFHSAQPESRPAPSYPAQNQHQASYLSPSQNGQYLPYGSEPSSHPTSRLSTNTIPGHRHMGNGPDNEWAPAPQSKAGGRRSKKQKVNEELENFGKVAPGVAEGIEVKTKFPVARIKRIMQADEDVGKVAQVTPTAVSKALELFMISLVTKAAAQARSKSAKKVTAAHLKEVVESDEQFDFLAEIISKVPDAPAPKKEEDSDGVGDAKKKRASGRRKRKDEDEM